MDVAAPQQQSFLALVYESLGLKYSLLLPAVALLAFVFALLIVIRGRGRLCGPALVLTALMPLLVGVYSVVEGLIAVTDVIASSSVAPKPGEFFMGVMHLSIGMWVAMILSVPSYLVAVGGAFLRTMIDRD